MKATRSTGAIACFNIPEEKYATLEKICRKEGIKIHAAAKEDFNKNIAGQFGILLPKGLGEPVEGKEYDFEEELLIIHITEESLFNKFLSQSRANDAVVNYKAVLTPTNSMWFPKDLKEELAKEHAYMAEQAKKQGTEE